MKTKINPFVLFFAALFILSPVVLSVLAWQEQKNKMETVEKGEFGNVFLKIKSIENHLYPVVADLAFIGNLHSLRNFLDNSTEQNKKNLQTEFLLAVFLKPYYDQIRFIDSKGMEVVRVNNNNGQPEIVPERQLQNKKNRYYFKDTMNLDRGQFYESPFDLNVENGKVEYPAKPMIRICMPVFDSSGEKRGMVIINYLGGLLLKDFAKNTLIHNMIIFSEENVWLINQEGFWLKGPNPGTEWSFMYNNKKNISFRNEYPNVWKLVLSTENGQIKNRNGLFTYATVFPFTSHLAGQNDNTESTTPDSYRWKVVSYIPASVLKKDTLKILLKYVVIFVFINSLSLIGNLVLARGTSRVREAENKVKVMLQKRSHLQALLLKIYQSRYADLKAGLKELINTAYGFLQIDYISIWMMNKENTRLTCMDIPVSSEIYPYTNMSIDFDSFPAYFNKVLIGDQIIADNALEHFATKGFKENYLIPHNVTSMLDSPIWAHGKIIGVFALALRGSKRSWTKEEKNSALQIASTIATMMETNERAKAEQEMKEAVMLAQAANRTKSIFLANMSHELRTPLNAIIGFSQILQLDKESLSTQQMKNVEYIKESGEHLLEMVSDILDLSKIESGKMEIEKHPFNLGNMLPKFMTTLQTLAEEKGINMELDINPDVGIIKADEKRIKEVFYNLLSNAIKFTNAGKKIGVKASVKDQTAVIEVWDQGRGIASEDMEKIFNPFEQVGKAKTGTNKGTGLGLAITRKLIEAHNGTLTVESKPGQGSRFTVTIPTGTV